MTRAGAPAATRVRRDHSTDHVGRRLADPAAPGAPPPVARESPRWIVPVASGRRSSHRVRLPAPLDARNTSRSDHASGRYKLSPLRTRHTACVSARRPPNGTAQSARATTARRTASRASARAPQSSWRSASRAPGDPPRHSHHQPCRVPVGRARDVGSRRGPCWSSAPHANAPCCPNRESTSSAARAPACPGRHAHSAPNALTSANASARVAAAASACDGPARAGSASERNATSPPRTRSATRVSPTSPVSAASLRQRPWRSNASSSERCSPSSPRLACAVPAPAITPSAPAPPIS